MVIKTEMMGKKKMMEMMMTEMKTLWSGNSTLRIPVLIGC